MRTSTAAVLAFASSIGLPLAARAENPSASDVAMARTLGLEGVRLADAGDCAHAIEKLERAEALFHAPTILVRLGECQIAIGKVVLGTESLQRVVREVLPPKAPKPFVDAQARAGKSLAAALPKIGKLRIHVDVPPGAVPLVKLDGEPVSAAALDADRPADPGAHLVEASAPGFRTAAGQANLQEGGSGTVSLKLEPEPAAATATIPAPLGPPLAPGSFAPPAVMGGDPARGGGAPPVLSPGAGLASPPARDGRSGSGAKTAGIVLIAVGGGGIAAGAVLGAIALSKRSTLDSACGPAKTSCPPTSQKDIDDMKSSATASTVAFAVGGGALATGLIVLLTARGGAAEQAPAQASLEPLVGLGHVGVRGAF